MRTEVLRPVFVDSVPDAHLMEPDALYVSIKYATVIHKCACGCGNETDVLLAPDESSLTYDGETISLTPSIGNWRLECKSHYWIKKNRIVWAADEKRHSLARLAQRVRSKLTSVAPSSWFSVKLAPLQQTLRTLTARIRSRLCNGR